jgi:hypothetical protein
MRILVISGRRGGVARLLVVLALAAMAVLAACTPAVALRPRTTPAGSARLEAAEVPAPTSPAKAVAHDLAMTRILARHEAAGGGAAAGPERRTGVTRMHRAVALGAQGTLAVATLAALAAIVLVVTAVIIGERRQGTSRRRTEETAVPTAATRRQVAG